MLFHLFMEVRKVIVMMCIGRKLQIIQKKVKLGSVESKENLDKSATKKEATQLLWMLFERSQEKR